jgi:pimeloyl-ACP methyl ester carboxylesterase
MVPAMPDLRHFGRWHPIPPIWLEGRIYIESLRLIRDPVFHGEDVPPGRRKPVMLIPGFLAGDWTLRTLFDWLRRVDYRPRMAGVALNVTYSEVMLRPLIDTLLELNRKTGARVSLVGHSRGGVLAKVLSHRKPDLIEQLITLGSPLSDPFDVHPLTMAGVRAAQLFNRVRYRHRASVEMRFLRDLAAAPRVPTTSIYSRSDGVVNWKACLRSDLNAIEVRGSHIGLALNPEVYRILAHLLPAPWRHN